MTGPLACNAFDAPADTAQPGRFELAGQAEAAKLFGGWAERVALNWKRWNELCDDPHTSLRAKADMFSSCLKDETSLRDARHAYNADPARWWRDEVERAEAAAVDADEADERISHTQLSHGG